MSFIFFWTLTILQVFAILLGGMSILTGHATPEQLTKYIFYCEWLIYAAWRVQDNCSSLLQSVGASEKVFQLMDLLPSDQFLSKGNGLVFGIEIPQLNEATSLSCVVYILH